MGATCVYVVEIDIACFGGICRLLLRHLRGTWMWAVLLRLSLLLNIGLAAPHANDSSLVCSEWAHGMCPMLIQFG